MDPQTARMLGIISVTLGAVTAGVQMLGGLCCGWIGWPLGLGGIVCGILAMVGGEKVLGAIGIGLPVAVVIMQLLIGGAGLASMSTGME